MEWVEIFCLLSFIFFFVFFVCFFFFLILVFEIMEELSLHAMSIFELEDQICTI
jgi:hypothetical protein